MLEILLVLGVIVYFVVEWRRRKPLLQDVTRRPVFITGCDSGFGRALARRLDLQSTPVFAGCFTEEGARTLTQESSDRLTTLRLDVSSTESIEKARDLVKANLPSGTELWAIVNNAGIGGLGGPLEWQCRKNFLDVFQVNILGMAEVTRLFLPLLKKSCGHIVNVTSAIAFNTSPGLLAYVCSKFAAEGLGDALRRELWQWGVSVHMIEPGCYLTAVYNWPKIRAEAEANWKSLPKEVQDQYGEDYLKQWYDSIEKLTSEHGGKDVSPVVNKMVHALFAVSPRNRYPCGLDANLALLMSYLPSTFGDWICKMLFRRCPRPKATLTPIE